MIANFVVVCYSYSMRKIASICGVIVVVAIGLHVAREELFSFIVIGKIPFTNLVIPSTAMVAFWIGIVPAYLFFAKSVKNLFWSSLSTIGQKHQQTLDRRYRASQRHTQALAKQSPNLAVIVAWMTITNEALAQQEIDDTKNKVNGSQLVTAPTA